MIDRVFCFERRFLVSLIGAALLVMVSPYPRVLADEATKADAAKIDLQWGVKILMRDGVQLNASVYTPRGQSAPAPCVFTLTPYISQSYHERGVYFAAHGLPFLTVDVRGRGNSGGTFHPIIQDSGTDGYDVVEWLARQPYCNGKVAMWGGSYAGYDQWDTAKWLPPHLASIVPVASPYPGTDFPYRRNIGMSYWIQWLTLTSGRASQDGIFADDALWNGINYDHYARGESFADFGRTFNLNAPIFNEWIDHPEVGDYYASYNPTLEQLKALTLPILTITGSYDDDQPGALAHYRDHMSVASPQLQARHYLVIGPWDHSGTRTPMAEYGGVKFGAASLVDLNKLHLDWYNWTMAGGTKPAFLKDQVAYYVMGRDEWRYAPSLDAVTARSDRLFLASKANADSVWSAGALTPTLQHAGVDHYLYDPLDISPGKLEREIGADKLLVDQSVVLNQDGKQLVYQSVPFETPTELSGFFKLQAWIAIDQPDTDFRATVYEIDRDGKSIMLSSDQIRARYRESLKKASLIKDDRPYLYDFDQFTFVSRQIAAGSRLRLVIDPLNSIQSEKNYNAAKPVAMQTIADARPVNVKLLHDSRHPSSLYIPVGQPESH